MKTAFIIFFVAITAALAADRVETGDQSGSIVLKINPDWATVTVDSTDYGQARQYDGSAAVLRVEPGTHIVKVSAKGYLDYEKRLYISNTREVLDVQLRSTEPGINAALPRRETNVYGSLYLIGEAVNPEGNSNAGLGASVEFSVNSKTVLMLTGEAIGYGQSKKLDSLYASVKIGTAVTPFDGDVKPQIGLLVGALSSPYTTQVVIEGFLRGLYSLSPQTGFYLCAAPEFTFGNNGGFYFNLSAGVRFRFGK